MKKLFARILLCIILILFVDFAIGKFMTAMLESTTKGDWGHRNYVLNETCADVLVFGGSRAIHHYNPQIISDTLHLSCYNCGEDGNGILTFYPFFESLLQRYTPQIVIYELIPKYDYLVYGRMSLPSMLRPYIEKEPVKNFVREVDGKEYLKLQSNLYKYNSSFLEILLQRFSSYPLTSAQFTFAPLVSEMDYDISDPELLEGEGLDSIKYHYLEKFVDLCHAHGVKLYFTTSPWYKMKYQDVYGPVEMLCQKKSVTFLNHNFDENFNLNKKYFHDPAHMDQYGAEAFSSVIAHEIKEHMQ